MGGEIGHSNLSTPLLPHGSCDEEFTTPTPQSSDRSTMAARALRKAPGRDRSRRRMSRVQSKRLSELVSDTNSVATEPMSNRSSYLDGDGEIEDVEKYPRDKMSSGAILKAALVCVGTVLACGSYLASFVYVAITPLFVTTAGTVSVGIAGGVCLLTAPTVLHKEWRLSKLPTIRRRINELRESAQHFKRGVDFLSEERSELELEVQSLQEGNAALEQIIRVEMGGNVDELVRLVQENHKILREMKDLLRQAVVQAVVKIVIQSDLDKSGIISKKEAQILAARLEISLQVYGIVFDTKKFLKVVGLSPSLPSVMRIVKRLLPDEDEDQQHPERQSEFGARYADSNNSSRDSEITDYGDDEEDELLDMFYLPIQTEAKKGCADAIAGAQEYETRTGRRATLISMNPRASHHYGYRCSVRG